MSELGKWQVDHSSDSALFSGLVLIEAFPCYRIANANDATFEHLRKDAAAPIRLKLGAKTGGCFVHALTRRQLAANLDSAGSNPEDASARVRQVNTAHQHVGAPGHRPRIALQSCG